MSDKPVSNEEAQKFYSNYNPKYRRRRKHQGASWTPERVSADVEDGVWCRFHRMRHGYKSNKLGVYYERRQDLRFQALWFCVDTGTVLKVMILGGERVGTDRRAGREDPS